MAGPDLPRDSRQDPQHNPPRPADPDTGLRWHCLPFAQVPRPMLYQALALRSRVFVVEQRCLYEDMDGADLGALLLVGALEATGAVAATARILPPHARFVEPSIGRVCVEAAWRGRGWGRLLMDFAIGCVGEHHPRQPIRISAQAYLQPFYASLGFAAASAQYLEDGIPHLEMLLAGRQSTRRS